MKPEQHSERRVEVAGWQVNLTTYKFGAIFHSTADNISPGANIARATGTTKEEAERKVLEKAKERLANTRRHAV